MPYVQVRVSVPLTKEKIEKLAEEILNTISVIPGKSAPVTMAEIVDDCHLYFGSVDGAPCAIADVAANNSPESVHLKEYSKCVCRALNEVAGIEMNRINIKHHGNPEWHTGRMFIE